MVNIQRTVMRADTALNTSLHRASVGRVMGKVRSVPVLLITVAGRRLGSSTPIPSSLEDDRRLVVTGSGLGPTAEPRWLEDRRAEIEMGTPTEAGSVAVRAGQAMVE